ncbi:hypothetical protein Scel_25010 [Streptomyces cellostaticus]|nr:hypothetical protein Scel_25010 [Streptomyces cellostaticus]
MRPTSVGQAEARRYGTHLGCHWETHFGARQRAVRKPAGRAADSAALRVVTTLLSLLNLKGMSVEEEIIGSGAGCPLRLGRAGARPVAAGLVAASETRPAA